MKRGHALVVEGDLAADEDIQDNTKAPHVDLGAGVCPSLEELRGGEVQATAEGLEVAAWREEVAQAKVDDFDVTHLADEDVLDLEVSVYNAVPVAIVEGTSNLTAELAGLLLLELPMGDDVVEHLAAVDIFEQHVPVVVGPDDVPHATHVRVVKQGDYCSLPRGADLLALLVTLLLCSAVVAVVDNTPGDDLARDLEGWRQMSARVSKMGGTCGGMAGKLTCSLLSSFLASFTLPMLPAPIVLPRIHFPDCVGIVVLDLALGWPEDLGSEEEGTAAGPVLCATVVAIAAAGRGCGGQEEGG